MSNNNEEKKFKPSVPHLPVGQMRGKPIASRIFLVGEGDKEKEAVGVQFAIVDGEHSGKTINKLLFFTDATIDITLKAMRAMGWTGPDPTNLAGMDAEVMLVIEDEIDEKYGGKRSSVRWVNAIGMNGGKALEGSRLAQFKSRVAGYAARQQQSNGAQTGKLPPVPAGDPYDDVPPGEQPPWMRR